VVSLGGVEPPRASFVARPPDPPAETWHRVRVSISLFEVENLAT